MTAPFLADTPTILRQSHGQVARVTATHPSFTQMPLDVTEATLTFDEERAPRATSSITCALVDEPALLDPLAGVRVRIEAGYLRPGGTEDVHTLADLGLRNRSRSDPNRTLRLDCAGDEARVVDAAGTASGTVTSATHSGAIIAIINEALSPAPRVTVSLTGGAVTVDEFSDRWSALDDIADRVGADVYDTGLRDWVIEARPVVADTPEHTLTVGEDGTVLESDATVSRDSWANYVFLRYRWTDASDVDHEVRATAYVASGPYAVTGPAGKRIFIDEREVATTQAQANAAAAAVLSRFISRSQSFTLRAVAAYWLRPGMTVSVTLPGRAQESHLIKRISFDLLEGTMQLETRLPETFTIATTTSTGTPDPDPAPPAAQSYTSRWVASSSRTYKGDGTENSFLVPDIAQGYFGATNGNQRSIVVFAGANSTGDETAKTITQALTGATVSAVRLTVYCEHTYSFAGGTARVGFYNGTSVPATFTGGSPYVSVAGWKKGSPRTVTITSSALIAALLAGTCRGVTFGPGVGSDQNYYMRFAGATASSNKPVIEIDYAK